MTLETSIKTLEALTSLSDAVPALGGPVKIVLEVAKQILKYAQEAKANKDATKELAETAAEWATKLLNTLNDIKDSLDRVQLAQIRRDVDVVIRALKSIEEFAARCTKENWFQRVKHRSEEAVEIITLQKKLDTAFQLFMVTAQLQGQAATYSAQANVSVILSDSDRGTLRSLGPIFEARYDARNSPTGCLQNTRVQVLDWLASWALQPAETLLVFWLTGLAGTGKSSIAKSFCKRLVENGTVMVCTFFASKNFSERRDPFRILYSFVCELAEMYPEFGQASLAAVRAPPEIKTRSMKEQVERLLTAPLIASRSRSAAPRSLILIIEALDECERIDGVKGGTLVPELVQALAHLPIKLFVTSRPEKSLQRTISSISSEILKLQDVDDVQVTEDVRRLWTSGFVEMVSDPGLDISQSPWPDPSDLEELVKRTGHFFIFAATALKYIGDVRAAQPEARLQAVIDQSAKSWTDASPYAIIDKLYVNILSTAAEVGDKELCGRIARLLGTIMILKEPLTIRELAEVKDLPEAEVSADVYALAAVLIISTSERSDFLEARDTVQIFHSSFRDFLQVRSDGSWFSLSPPEHHQHLTICCFNLLTKQLDSRAEWSSQYFSSDMLNDQTSGWLADESCSAGRNDEPSFAFKYVRDYWTEHMCAAGSVNSWPHLLHHLRSFVSLWLSRWITSFPHYDLAWPNAAKMLPGVMTQASGTYIVSTIARDLSIKSISLTVHKFLLESRNSSVDLNGSQHHHDLAVTCLRELNNYLRQDICKIGSPSIANSDMNDPELEIRLADIPDFIVYASQFWPLHLSFANISKSLVNLLHEFASDHTFHWFELLSLLNMIPTAKCLLERALTTLNLDFGPFQIQYTPTWDLLDEVLRALWIFSPALEKHALHAYFSLIPTLPDLQLQNGLSSDNLPRLLSGKRTGYHGNDAMEGHLGYITTVMFSNDGTRIVSGSLDGTLRTWDVKTGRELFTMRGHTGWVTSVAFSPDGLRLASGSDDCTVRLWDVVLEQEIKIIHDHTSSVMCVSFSHNGKQLLSSSIDGEYTICISSHVGEQSTIHRCEGHSDRVESLAFSPDGFYLVSGSQDRTVRLWDVCNGVQLAMVYDRRYWGTCVAWFSHTNGIKVLFTSMDDFAIRIWDASLPDQSQVSVLIGHNMSVRSVAVSLDETQLVSCAADGSIRHWDIRTGAALSVLEHDAVSVAFSPDSAHIAVGSADRNLRILNPNTGIFRNFNTGHTKEIIAMTFSHDGCYIASASLDETLRIWNTKTGLQVSQVQYTSGVYSGYPLEFSPDGKYLTESNGVEELTRWAVATFMGSADDVVPDSVGTDVLNRASEKGHILTFDQQTGWISCQHRHDNTLRLCWLPEVLRGHAFASHGTIFAVGALDGQMTILDFAGTLQMFRDLGVLE